MMTRLRHTLGALTLTLAVSVVQAREIRVAVVTDGPALEMLPVDASSLDTFLHIRLIALLGIAIGEIFQLDELAAHCATDGVYEGMFVAAPLNKVGGSGSPANAVAIK